MSDSDRRRFVVELSGAVAALTVAGRAGASAPRDRVGARLADDLETWARANLPRFIEQAGVPGAAMAVIRKGQVAWAGGVGLRAAGKGPVGPDTIFEAASLSKPLLAYAVLMLRDQGKIDLDRPLAEYLGASPVPDDERGGTITPRHILSHSTGLMNWRQRREDAFRTAFAPGSQFQYSGEGFVLLQRAVERITGTAYGEYMRDAVLAPLGMTRSSFTWQPEMDEAIASGHTNRGQTMDPRFTDMRRRLYDHGTRAGKPPASWTYDDAIRSLGEMTPAPTPLPMFVYPNAAASLLTTAADYAAFMRHVMGLGGGPKPSEASRRLMAEPQVKVAGSLSWGLGWGLERLESRQLLWHWGDNPGFKNYVVIDPQTQWGVVVFTNGNGGMRVCERVVRAAGGADRDAFLWI